MLFSINYDLYKPGQDDPNLYKRIKTLGSRCHPLDSIRFVETTSTATQVRDHLGSVKDELSNISNQYVL
jgi:hypothetical protein